MRIPPVHVVAVLAVAATAAPPGVQVTRVQGEVEARSRSGGSRGVAAGGVLEAGTVLATSPGANVSLRFPDGTEVDLGAETSLEIAPPEAVRGLRLVARDGSQLILDPGTRLLLAWPKSGDPSARDGRPDFRIVLDGGAGLRDGPAAGRGAPAARTPPAEPNLPVGGTSRTVGPPGGRDAGR